jgi:membrane fusion protein (multidrug efflux system)
LVKRKALIAVPIVLVLIVAGAAFWWWQRGHESTDDAEVDAHIATLSARVAGTVTAVYVQENDSVKKGQLLAELDPRDYEVALQRAEADLDMQQAQLHAGEARIREARANHRRARLDAERYSYLVRENAVPRMQYDEKRAAADVTAAAVASARAEANPRSRSARLAAIASARAALERARLDLQYTRIFAPADGLIGRRAAEVGQQVQPGQQLFAFVDTGELWITAYFKETQLQRMRPGQRARVHVDALDRDYDGTIESLGAASGARFSLLPPENATGNFVKVVQRIPVRIGLRGDLEGLRPGMSVEPKVYLR